MKILENWGSSRDRATESHLEREGKRRSEICLGPLLLNLLKVAYQIRLRTERPEALYQISSS